MFQEVEKKLSVQSDMEGIPYGLAGNAVGNGTVIRILAGHIDAFIGDHKIDDIVARIFSDEGGPFDGIRKFLAVDRGDTGKLAGNDAMVVGEFPFDEARLHIYVGKGYGQGITQQNDIDHFRNICRQVTGNFG